MNKILTTLIGMVLILSAGKIQAADQVIITEFVTKNENGIRDEDGSEEDWIEIFNAGTNAVNLLNWSLTDSASNPTKWRFPATNIAPGSFMLIWASDKDRRTPGAPLHTSFKLDPNPGEYLALVRPDLTVASRFSPTYPVQAQDISYGYAVTATTNVLIGANTQAKYFVPADFSQDPLWTDPVYDDANWSNGVTGIGYGYAPPAMSTSVASAMSNVSASVYLRVPFDVANASTLSRLYLKVRYDDGFIAYLNGQEIARRNAPSAADGGEVANSTNDWSPTGAQGANDWFYGYYNRSSDTNDNSYSFATDFNSIDELWRFTGTNWVLGLDDPPHTMIGATNWMPNGAVNSFVTHWPIRRWISPVSGVVTARVSVAKVATTGSGATVRIFLNGSEFFSRTLSAADTTGLATNLVVRGLDAGDIIDFALDPTGTDSAANDTGDLCRFFAVIDQAANSDPGFDSFATGPGSTANASVGDTIDISSYASFLASGTNVLAVHGLNVAANDADFLLRPELSGVIAAVNTNQPVYFLTPTPGAVNGTGTTNLGPLIVDVAHAPHEPLSNELVTVTARAIQTFNPVGSLTLRYRVMFLAAETAVPMFDDGQHGDGGTNDGVFAATIPANIAKAGEMVRYYIASADTAGRTNRSPSFLASESPQYWGYMYKDLSVTSALPVLHWFISNPSGANNDTGTRCSIYYNGQFLDNVGVTLHGQSSASFPKRSHNFNLNSGYKLKINDEVPALSDFAMISTWADRSHMRIPLNSEGYQKAGVPAHYAFMLRVQQNGTFYCVANFHEQGNNEYLERIGFDPDGALYKMYNTFTGAAGNEKKTRKYEPSYDLQALYNALTQPDTAARTTYIYDNVNIPSFINFVAAKSIASDHDCCHKNYYFYRDSNGAGEWYALPWDFDLSYGHVWQAEPAGAYFNDTIVTNLHLGVGNNNTLLAIMWADPVFKQMWMRRTRSITDSILQTAGTPASNDLLRARIDELASMVQPDAALDRAKWGTRSWVAPSSGPANPSSLFDVEVLRLKDYYLPGRRTFLSLPGTMTTYGLPTSQPAANIIFGAVEYRPANSNQAQEYIELINTNLFAVDVSGWRLTGGIEFTFAPGTIITATNRLFVSPDVKAFRARTAGPRAGQRRVVIGPYRGQLSARGELLTLVTDSGHTNSSLAYPGAPTLAQEYLRITELMYSPAVIAGPFGREDYEYVELRNISTNQTVPLNGVKFVEGISFHFAGSTITQLAPGERCLIVRSNAAFNFRYGSGLPVAGSYTGSLDNNGERIRLLDMFNEEIHDFSYDNEWYPITDGLGFSLVVVNETAGPEAWNTRAQWRPSGRTDGSPATIDPEQVVSAAVRVNEVLASSVLPEVDAVELFNPTTNAVNLSGWFLTDNFDAPKKYRIPNGTTISAGGYLMFDETQFNSGGAGFAFSSLGEEVFLFAGDAGSTNLTGYYFGFDFGPSDPGVSFGPYVNSITNEFIVAQASNTLGVANSLPRVGPIVISEVMFHPPSVAGSLPEEELHEFVELHNIGTNPVPLFDVVYPTNRWRLRDAVDFVFSTNDVIAPGGYLVVVGFDPATNAAALDLFRGFFGLDSSVAIIGPYHGSLNNAGDDVELVKPQPPSTNGVAYVLFDRVGYTDEEPWLAAAADGLGGSLQRIVLPAFADDPTNWVAAAPSPGSSRGEGPLPIVTRHPTNAWALVGETLQLSIEATGAPLRFQWRLNGEALYGQTNSILLLTNAQMAQSGTYDVVVLNGAGMALTEAAQVDILRPIYFSRQPASQSGPPGTNATFTAAVVGNGPVTFQWRFNGEPIAQATNDTLIVPNAQLYSHSGFYDLTVADSVSTATSEVAVLVITMRPVITNAPTATTVLYGGTAMFEVVAGPVHPLLPITNTWAMFQSVGLVTNTAKSRLYILNCTNNGYVRLRVSNGGGQSNITVGLTVTVLPDADRDGMADNWETNNGFSSTDPADAASDLDGDGMINRDEYVAGTDPTDPASVLRLSVADVNRAVLEFTAQSNISYTIQVRTNLASGVWMNWSNIAPASQPQRAVPFVAQTNDLRFYRVVTPQLLDP